MEVLDLDESLDLSLVMERIWSALKYYIYFYFILYSKYFYINKCEISLYYFKECGTFFFHTDKLFGISSIF